MKTPAFAVWTFHGIVGPLTRVRGTRGRYPLCLIIQGLMAGCSWSCTCGGRRASWWHRIGCVLLRGGGAGGGGGGGGLAGTSHNAERG